MRLATLTLAMLGLLCVGTTFADAQEPAVDVPSAPHLTSVADRAAVTPVRWYVSAPGPRWYGYYRYPPYTYRPRAYWYGPSRYYGYYADPYPGDYYYPDGFGFEFRGPRRSFSFGF